MGRAPSVFSYPPTDPVALPAGFLGIELTASVLKFKNKGVLLKNL